MLVLAPRALIKFSLARGEGGLFERGAYFVYRFLALK